LGTRLGAHWLPQWSESVETYADGDARVTVLVLRFLADPIVEELRRRAILT
jgi:hypothetical protein